MEQGFFREVKISEMGLFFTLEFCRRLCYYFFFNTYKGDSYEYVHC